MREPRNSDVEVSCWTVARLVARMAERADAPAILFVAGDRVETWSYRELADTVLRLVAGLREAGVQSGDPVALYGPNTPEWAALALAANAAGATTVPIDDLSSEARVAAVLGNSGARLVFAASAHLDTLCGMMNGDGPRIFLMDREDVQAPDARSWRSLLAATPAPVPDIPADRPACLFYTSGTTGPPKAFVLTHANIGPNVEALATADLLAPGDRVLLPLPLHHAYPYIVGMLTSLECGLTLVLLHSVTGPEVVRALHVTRVRAIVGVPRLYEALLAGVEARLRRPLARSLFSSLLKLCLSLQRNLGLPLGRWLLRPVRCRIGPELRLLISGGAHLDAEVSWKLETLGWDVLAGYGLAETASVFTANLPGRKKPGSAGLPLADGRVRIAHPDAEGIGEIELSGSCITRKYRDNPAANRAGFTEDGWFRTGDLGYLDEDGFLFVTGRKKEAIVLGGGKKVNPEALEKVYLADPMVGEIGVLERGGQLVALVRPDPDWIRGLGTLNIDRAVRVALAEVGQTLPDYERLAGFAIPAAALPRTRLGKIRRFLLPEVYDAALKGTGAPQAAPFSDADRDFLSDATARSAWELLQKRYAGKRPSLDSHLALDLGIDSLEWMSLSLELETRTGVAFAGEDMAAMQTVRDLIATLVHARAEPRTGVQTWQQRLLADRERWLSPLGPATRCLGFLLFTVNKILLRGLFRLRVEGLGNLPPNGAFLVVPNHVSDLDPPAIAAALPYSRLRTTYWAGDARRLFHSALRRLFCRAMHVYPVDERVPSSAISMAGEVLDRGNASVWFAEGWRSPDGRLQPFLPGIGQLVEKHPVPVVPAYVSGTFEALPRHKRWPRAHPIRVIFGPPVSVDAAAGDEREPVAQRIADNLRSRVAALGTAAGDEV